MGEAESVGGRERRYRSSAPAGGRRRRRAAAGCLPADSDEKWARGLEYLDSDRVGRLGSGATRIGIDDSDTTTRIGRGARSSAFTLDQAARKSDSDQRPPVEVRRVGTGDSDGTRRTAQRAANRVRDSDKKRGSMEIGDARL